MQWAPAQVIRLVQTSLIMPGRTWVKAGIQCSAEHHGAPESIRLLLNYE